MTTVAKNIETDFSSGVNLEKLTREIDYNLSLISQITIHGNTIQFKFDSTLNGGQLSTLDSIITSHGASGDKSSMVITTINAGDTHIDTHFIDKDYDRLINIDLDTNDTYDDRKFTLNDTFSSDYTITNPSNASLNSAFFSLIGSGYAQGGNIATTGTATASSETQPAVNAIDNNTGTFWYNNTSEPAVGSWWKINFGSITPIYGCEVMWYSTTYYATDVSIEYSNDDTNWTLGLRQSGLTYTSAGNSTGRFKFNSFTVPIFARYFRFTCNKSNNATYFIFKEVYMYEAAASGFSTGISSTLTNIKENRQFDTSNISTINSSTIVGAFPTNTLTKILLSFDNQSTWVYWTGSAWQTTTIGNISSSYMSHTTFNSLTASNYNASGGLNSSTNTIDMAVNISTTSSIVSPVISEFLFNVTTTNFRQRIGYDNIRIRMISPIKTEFKNLTNQPVDLIAKIWID